MKIILILLCVFLSAIEAQENLAIINDPDGYTNIRKDKILKSEIISKVFANEIFYYQRENEENWWKVRLHGNIEGYMRKSRILPIDQISNEAKKDLILYIFNREITFYKNYLEDKSSRHKSDFHLNQLDPILIHFFPKYVCTFKDTTVLLRFFDIINLETGSADESPAWALGYIFLCQPDFTIRMLIKHYTDLLLGDLEFGFGNVTYQKENEIENFDKLKFKMDSLLRAKRNIKKEP